MNLKRISWQAIFTGATSVDDATSKMDSDTTKDASGASSFDGARPRASTSISVARQSIDFSTATTPTTTPTASSNSSVAKSHPSRCSPPPSYLLDDDPFANLTPMTIGTRHRASSSVGSTSSCIPRCQRPPPIHPELMPRLSLPAVPAGLQAPKSRLQKSLDAGADESDKGRRARSQDGQKETKGKKEESKRKRFITMSAPVSPSKTLFTSKVPVPPLPAHPESISLPTSPHLPYSSGVPPPITRGLGMTRMQPRPAHQRPAFAARPSLPSLDALAKTNVVLTIKGRKGRVGAGLPFEPWDDIPEDVQHAPFMPATSTTLPMLAKTLMTTDADRTPTCTPVSVAPPSPTRSSPSTRTSAISTKSSPQPLLSQNVALGQMIEVDIARPLWSPPLRRPSFSADTVPALSSSELSTHFVESDASILKTLEAANDMFGHNGDQNSMEVPDEENGYFTGDLLDTYGISCTPEPEPEFHDWTNELDPETLANKESKLRWSVATYDSNGESQPQSPSSNSYAGSVSDLSSGPSYPPSYSFGYGWSNSERASVTDIFRDSSLSRSISSTSISASSIGDDIESNWSRFRSPSTNTSDSSQGTDVSQSCRLSSRSSTLIASSDSGNNSILHSPDSEWTYLAQQQYLPDVLVGPALQKRAALPSDDSTADHESQTVQAQVDSGAESKMPIISTLRNSGHADPEDETTRSQQNSHAVAQHKWQATADDLFPTSSSDSAASPNSDLVSAQELLLVAPVFCSATTSHQSSLLGTAPQPILEPVPSATSSTLDPPERFYLETEPNDLDEMNGVDKRLREKMTYDQYHFAVPSDFGPRKSAEEEKERRRMVLRQMRGDRSFQSSQDIESSMYSGLASTPSATPRGVTSTVASPQVSSGLSTPSTSGEEEQISLSSDDDIPLAQRIPGALTAQQSIRKQVKKEREARRAEREKRQRERQAPLRPAAPALESTSIALSSSQGAALHAPVPVYHVLRQRSASVHQRPAMPTIHSAPLGDFGQAFKPEDLARKLQNVKITSENSLSTARFQQSLAQVPTLSRSVSGTSRPPLEHPQHSISASPAPVLKPKRSFHAPEVERHSRDAASSREQLPLHKRSMSVGRERERTNRRGHEDPVPPLPGLVSRKSLDDHRERGRRVLVKPHADSKVTTPYDLERLQHSNQGTPTGADVEGVATSRHRIFIHSLQHPHLVDIRANTSAGDLITSLETDGVLDGWAGLGGWMFWEIAQDFGMERPVRNYELLSDVQASWLKEKSVNYFLLKKSSLSPRLDPLAIPSSAPSHSGWVEWEAKRGKWSKRWLRLKENSLYISKKDGREETVLCSLSNFDAYYLTRSHRAPKPFAFTIKSTDNLSFFENTADYMHTFSCSEKNGEAWVETILLARSYVLRQERSALFHPKGQNNVPNPSATISRSGTKKATVPKPQQPLVDLSPGDIFAPGSLLSKQ